MRATDFWGMELVSEIQWYALYTRPRAEKKLANYLKQLQIEAYLPLVRKRKKWSDRYKWIEEPVFASYLFVRIDWQRQALRVLKLPQAMHFVSREAAPVPIKGEDIDLLRVAVEDFSDSLVIRDTSSLSTGEIVTIQDGPFVGREAVIERIHGKVLVIVSFPAISKSIQVEVPVTHVAQQSVIMQVGK